MIKTSRTLVGVYLIIMILLFSYLLFKFWPVTKLTDLSLEDLLAFEDVVDSVREAIAVVPQTATLGDAQAAMDKVENCQDILVTRTGERQDRVVGWLTNVDIARYLTA